MRSLPVSICLPFEMINSKTNNGSIVYEIQKYILKIKINFFKEIIYNPLKLVRIIAHYFGILMLPFECAIAANVNAMREWWMMDVCMRLPLPA